MLLMRKFGMRMHERDGVGDRRPLRRHGGDDIRVADRHT